jgi:hypothetical protein
MEALLKIHKSKPIQIPLPGNQIIDLFITDYQKDDSDPIAATYHKIKCFYYNSTKLNYLTDKIIKSYIVRHLNTHLKLFSINGNIIPIIEVR